MPSNKWFSSPSSSTTTAGNTKKTDRYAAKSPSESQSPEKEKLSCPRPINNNQFEVDFNECPTKLYQEIEAKKWDLVIKRIDSSPSACRTWVFRLGGENGTKVLWRLLPIHAIFIFKAPLSVVEKLVEAYPEGVQETDDQDMLPVHLACRNGATKDIVMALLDVFPEGIEVIDRKGRTPLQLVTASYSPNRTQVMQALNTFIQEHTIQEEDDASNDSINSILAEDNNNNSSISKSTEEESRIHTVTEDKNNNSDISKNTEDASQIPTVTEVDFENLTTLFHLIIKKQWKKASLRCTTHPLEVDTWVVAKGLHGNLRFLPIHKVCALRPPVTVVQFLLNYNPDCAKSTDQDGWLPLHSASFYGAGKDVVEALLLANPNGARTKDNEGRMPLHYASLKAADEGVIAALVRSHRMAAISTDNKGWLPIHHACSKGASQGVIETLIKASWKVSRSKDDQGRLPLHHACRNGAGERVVKALLDAHPKGAQVKDDQKKLAIHYACLSRVNTGVVTMLMSAYPDCVNSKDGFEYTPIDLARAISNTPIVTLIEKLKAKHDLQIAQKKPAKLVIPKEDEDKDLTERVNYLESLLAEVAQMS